MGTYPPNDAGELAAQALKRGDPTGWFERLYAGADAEGRGVPWARLAPDPGLVAWLDAAGAPAAGQTALIVGCGLGDDAEAAAQRGYTVTAFDVSPSAIELCRQRFPGSPVTHVTADLFSPPAGWQQAFDLVVEVMTVQALPPALHEQAIRQIASFVAPGGVLFIETALREPSLKPSGPPWPLAEPVLGAFRRAGLVDVSHTVRLISTWSRVWRAQVVYRRPARGESVRCGE